MHERIGVMGAGVMGSGIAQVMAVAGHPVVCYDPDPGARAKAATGVSTGRFGVRGAVERGKLAAEDADAALARISFTDDADAVAAVDVVIEAVPERLDLKVRLFRDLDARCAAGTVLASNSSGFPIAALAAATERAERVATPSSITRIASRIMAL